MKNYKDTLLMPTTAFEMRANLREKEPQIQAKWANDSIVDKVYAKNKGKKERILHDGPPYANGDIHVGHALNKILKDIIVRYLNLKGYYSPWICGWDTHGLPIETAVTNSGVDRKTTHPTEFRNTCANYALGQIENQIQQFTKLGLLTNFNNKYVTLNLHYELEQIRLFKKMVEKNLVYRNLKPIYWSCSSESALAEAEIEYQVLSSPSIYVKFRVKENHLNLPDNTAIVIWTTTPWTIPMNQMLAVNNDLDYGLVKVNNEHFIIAKELVESVAQVCQWNDYEIIASFKGSELVGTVTTHPIYNRDSQVYHGDHVSVEAGTGIVHTAPGFGEDDYELARKHNIEIFAPLNDEGKYTSEINDNDLIGVFYDDANKIVSTKLKENDNLLSLKFIKHKYPVDWRTKKPVIYRATSQWFVSIENIKSEILSEIQAVQWHPYWSQSRMREMITNRQDWCISRQRLWGVPIIAFYDQNNEPQLSSELIDYVLNLFAEQGSTNIWFEWETDRLLPEQYRNLGWKKETNIMDVWFDSGVSNLVVRKEHNFSDQFYLYLEGNDQYRGWFNSSLICSVIGTGKSPYQKVLSHGFVNDENGLKMSKSKGNVVNPQDIINQYGADILRLWVASVDFTDDVKIGPEIVKQIAESYRKIRNTIRFILANLSDFNVKENSQVELSEVDNFVLYQIKQFKDKAQQLYEEFNFNNLYLLINNCIVSTLSKFYLDFIKDIIYVEKANSKRRRQVQTTLYYIYRTLIDVLKPIIPHTTEEAHNFIKYDDYQESVHLEDEFEFKVNIDNNLIAKWEKVMSFRDEVNKELERLREQKIITKSLTCQIEVCLKDGYHELKEIPDLHQILITSAIKFVDNPDNDFVEYNSAYLKAYEKQGYKCQRCWLIVDEYANNSEICQRCYDVVYN